MEEFDFQEQTDAQMKAAGFELSDFGTDGLTPEEHIQYHTELGCSFRSANTFWVDSRSSVDPHIVTHNFVVTTECGCRAGQYRKCKPHLSRGMLVLIRRHNRKMAAQKEVQERDRREHSPLAAYSKPFNLFR